MLRRAIFSSPSGRLLERGSIDHAIRVELDQMDEGFWLKHAAVGKPQAPGRRSVAASPPPRGVLRLGPASISFSTLTIKCIDVEVGQRRPPNAHIPAQHRRFHPAARNSRLLARTRAKHTRPACRC
jgi:hypothetical protein